MNEVLQILGCGSAALFGWAGVQLSYQHQQSREHQMKMRRAMGVKTSQEVLGGYSSGSAYENILLRFWVKTSLQIETHALRTDLFAQKLFGRSSNRWLQKNGRLLALPQASWAGLCESRFRLGILAGVLLALLVYALTSEWTFALAAALLGLILGSQALFHAAKSSIAQRKKLLESELPEALALISLGLKSGLSFDQSFALYAAHFDTDFSRASAQAQKTWTMALSTREEALRALAASYDSPQLKQVVESMIRSLRFGTALSENLDTTAAEARNQYKATCQEAIAKAPVRMLIPTCALILPALLILVLGPILLGMASGF